MTANPPQPQPTPAAEVITILADTIQGQAEAHGQTLVVLNSMRDDNTKIIKKLNSIQRKLGARDQEDDEPRCGSVHWTENKLLMVFMILLALIILSLVGVKVGEVAGFFKQTGVTSELPGGKTEKEK